MQVIIDQEGPKVNPEQKLQLFFGTILGKPKDEYGHFNDILACQCLSELEHFLVEGAEELLIRVLHVDSGVAIEATKAFRKIASEQVVNSLIRALRDDNKDVQRLAAEALEKVISEYAADLLIGALGDEYEYVRRTAAEALGKIGGDRAVDPLIGALGDEKRYVRNTAAEALGRIGSEQSMEGLIGAANHSFVPYFHYKGIKKFFREYSLKTRTPFYRKGSKWHYFDQKQHWECKVSRRCLGRGLFGFISFVVRMSGHIVSWFRRLLFGFIWLIREIRSAWSS